jgi:hypothetical protein
MMLLFSLTSFRISIHSRQTTPHNPEILLPPPPHHHLEDRTAAMSVNEVDSFFSSYSYQINNLQFMQAQESYYRISADYLSSSSTTITADDRHALCSWSYQIIESLSNINREISCIGMSYLDRFMLTR